MCPIPWSKLRASLRNVACASSNISIPYPIIYFVQFTSVQFYCECTGLWCNLSDIFLMCVSRETANLMSIRALQ